jgi:hypothetical protein
MSASRPESAPQRVVPAATSPLTGHLVADAPQRGTVAGVHRYGVYVAVAGTVVPVLCRDAVALPTAVRLGVASHEIVWGVRAGDDVRVGSGAVRLGRLEVRATRTWRPARVRVRAGVPGGTTRDGETPLAPLLAPAGAPDWLVRGARAAVTAADPTEAVASVVGRGAGLTPSGDDALAGALLVHHALGGPSPALVVAVRGRLASTTAVSAALLDAAADGWAAPQVVALVDAAVSGDRDAVARHLPAVLAIGHTSGRDLVTGVDAALHALVPHTPTGRTAA